MEHSYFTNDQLALVCENLKNMIWMPAIYEDYMTDAIIRDCLMNITDFVSNEQANPCFAKMLDNIDNHDPDDADNIYWALIDHIKEYNEVYANKFYEVYDKNDYRFKGMDNLGYYDASNHHHLFIWFIGANTHLIDNQCEVAIDDFLDNVSNEVA